MTKKITLNFARVAKTKYFVLVHKDLEGITVKAWRNKDTTMLKIGEHKALDMGDVAIEKLTIRHLDKAIAAVRAAPKAAPKVKDETPKAKAPAPKAKSQPKAEAKTPPKAVDRSAVYARTQLGLAHRIYNDPIFRDQLVAKAAQLAIH